jgi:2-oxoisovalerate dehydrogenase E1 component
MTQIASAPILDADPTTGARAIEPISHELAKAVLIRKTEERLLQLYQEGKLFGTVHTCLGQEWTGVAVAQALRQGDFIVSNHRCHGHYLAWTDDVEGLIAEVMGKETGVCGGRGGSQHLCKDGFFSNGIQGGMMPVAAGMAFAKELRGESAVGVIFIGDGTLGEGVLYEALNVVSRWRLPLLVVLENNFYSQSTAQHETLAGRINARAAAFGIRTSTANTQAWGALLAGVGNCVDDVRSTRAPHFLRIDTYRLGPHSKGDDTRDRAEIAAQTDVDSLTRILSMQEEDAALAAAVAEIDGRIARAVERADVASVQTPAGDSSGPETTRTSTWSVPSFPEERVVRSIRRGLGEALERDQRVVLLGEDIESPYGGAFKVSEGLSTEFPGRVRNTPISEAAIVGIGSGLALEGFRPVVEIMFGDFLLLAADQIVNHAAKFRWMYNDKVSVPLIVRTPMGGGRGYGPTHSQSLEKHLLGVPGTQVLALHQRYSPALTYRRLFETIDRPSIIIENKVLYGSMVSTRPPDGYVLEVDDDEFPTARLRPRGKSNLTLVAYGGMVAEAEAAMQTLFDEYEVGAELIVPLRLYPLNVTPIAESVTRTGRVVIVEEGQGFAGFGGELISRLVENDVTVPMRRVSAAPQPIPTSRSLEQVALPRRGTILAAALEILDG